jgi:serine/threonine protein kinase
MSGDYIRVCPVCGAEHAPTVNQCVCGTLLIGVDLSLRGQPAIVPTESKTAPAAPSIPCPHADCGAPNPPGSAQCLYCGRSLAAESTPMPAAGLYNLPTALSVNFAIERVLPAGGAEAELMLLKGLKTGVQVMAKLYRPGIAPKGEVLEQVGRVAHAHVVRTLAHGVSDGVAYEVMEYCTGGSLRDLMGDGAVAPERVRSILAELAEALAALHECRVVHRDLKPENVLVRRLEPLDLVLTDFGIASLQDATQLFTGTARTARYAAPEAMTGILDQSADYWSLGMMLVEMLLGEHPFAGLSDPVIAHRLATGSVDTADIRDPSWRRLCRGLLQRDPARRWGIAEIRRWLAGDDTLPEPEDSGTTLLHPYQVADQECRSTTELALAFSRHWEAARKDLTRGYFEAWVREQLKDHNLVRYLHDLKDRGGDADLLLFELIRHLAPTIPLAWRGQSLSEDAIFAAAARAAERDRDAAEWLESLFSQHVLELVSADESPALAKLAPLWSEAWSGFVDAWRAADQALGKWRQSQVDSGEVVVDIDTLMFGIDGGLRRPAPGLIHGPLLLALHRPDYARQLRTATLAEAAAHFEHSPWLEDLCRQAQAEDLRGVAALVAVLHLLPQAKKASEDGHRRIAARKEERADELERLVMRVNETLAGLREASTGLAIVQGAESRQRLVVRLEEFLALGREARALIAGAGPRGEPALRAVARAEPLVLGMRDRLDEWESAHRISELWRNEHVAYGASFVFFALLAFAPRWLLAIVVVPTAFAAWRLWIAVDHRGAIRRLAAGLPPRVPRVAPS